MLQYRHALDELIKERSESYSSISRLIARNPAYIQQYITRGSPAVLDESDRRKIAQYFDVPETRIGPVSKGRGGDPRLVKVALLPTAAGQEPDCEQEYVFDLAWMAGHGLGSEPLAILKIAGDTMEPTLKQGDEVLVARRRSKAELRDGLYALRLADGVAVRRLALSPSGSLVSVLCDNPAYPDWEGIKRSNLNIIGRVVWHGRRLV